ncbi:MAG: hypothetical protein WKG32_20570 [Gemmatimonadaceae bacterium]
MAEGYGFRPGNPSEGFESYVIMQQNSSYPSGHGPTDKNTYANAGLFTHSVQEMGGLIAHEERHQHGADSPQHNTGAADATQALCDG